MAVFEVPKEQPEDETYPDEAIRSSFDDIEEFNEYLTSYYFRNIDSADLHLVPGVTQLSSDEFVEKLGRREWHIDEEYGSVKRISHDPYGEGGHAGAYFARDDDSGYFILYTNEPKRKYVDKVIISDLRVTYQTNRLHAPAYRIEDLVNDLTTADDDTPPADVPYADQVHLKRSERSEIKSQRDTDNKRTISYWGDDAASIVTEFRREFGVLVDSIKLRFPDSTTPTDQLVFKIGRSGVLKLIRGDLNDMLEKVNPIIEQTLDVKRAYDDTETDRIELAGTDTEISQSSPALITPGDEDRFTKDGIQASLDALGSKSFIPIDTYIETDPLYYNTTIYHVGKRIYFDIRGDGGALRIFPRAGEEELKTFFGVLEAVQKNAISSAETHSVTEVGQ
ncbi:hypothetical protein [Halorhabdus salina]|uniref:hypothetical protein n=1 Tax=Halorhabdus salina TaxID=2750670 RepID=UPI0015EFAA02|nr:hypothetical protein [Halorhabdus salina]